MAGRPVFFFDIDNCLYPRSYKIHDIMGDLIDDYFQHHLSLSREDARRLHQRYYKDYGLAIEGLVRHHKIDAMEYNRQVDDALPLDEIIKPNSTLRRLLQDMDKSKVKMWLFTNAYLTHGQRVVKLLKIDDLFEGITFCDYAAPKLLCKPSPEMFSKAMREAGVTEKSDCFFVGMFSSLLYLAIRSDDCVSDDSQLNVAAAKNCGWTSVHLVEPSVTGPEKPLADYQIQDLEELRDIFPQFFKQS